ncbi:MAG: hypothetical protein M3R25_05025 [Bacteroidota bacterium]|nr:hypothetical protein [Bacteroidota bacterium]
MKGRLLGILSLLLVSITCKKSHDVSLSKLDLRPFGINLDIMAPTGAVIDRKDYGAIGDITVRQEPYYDLQIIEADTIHQRADDLKDEELQALWQEVYFKELVQDDKYGFIFKTRVDSLTTGYDFRYFKIIGAKEYRFQVGLTEVFELEDVKRMYKAVKL